MLTTDPGTTTDPRKDPRWKRVARMAKAEAGWKCRACGRPHSDANPLEADHIHPIQFGGDPFDPANVRVLCPQCHDVSAGKRPRAVNYRQRQDQDGVNEGKGKHSRRRGRRMGRLRNGDVVPYRTRAEREARREALRERHAQEAATYWAERATENQAYWESREGQAVLDKRGRHSILGQIGVWAVLLLALAGLVALLAQYW